MRFTLKEVVDFCWNNKREKNFKNAGYRETGEHILWAAENNKLLIVADEQGLCGVCTLTVDEKRVYVHHIVAVRNGFITLLNKGYNEWRDKEIQGFRRSKIITFNKERLWAILHRALMVQTDLSSLT